MSDKPGMRIGNIGAAGDVVNGDKYTAGGDINQALDGGKINSDKAPKNKWKTVAIIVAVVSFIGTMLGLLADAISLIDLF